MNVLFLCLGKVWDTNNKGIYSDLLNEFVRHNHNVYIVNSIERKYKEKTQLIDKINTKIIKVKTLNIQKSSLLEKGVGTILVDYQFLRAIRKYCDKATFDLILYATPPITLIKSITYIKKRDKAKTYLLLKDIFPQNAVDLGMLKTTGMKGLLYKYFRRKEKKLYAISNRIGCMSQGNVDYILKHNPEIDPSIVEICPNSIEVRDLRLTDAKKLEMRNKYGIPTDKKVFVYGGNLGKPQGIPFLIDCLRAEQENDKVFFLIVGDGTEYGKLEAFVNEENPANVKLMRRLPKDDYDRMIAACDVGMIFLDHRFTIPNFPSRLLSYMQAGLPVLACTDPNTDIGKVITDGGFGWWCESDDVRKFTIAVDTVLGDSSLKKAEKGLDYLKNNYDASLTYRIIEKEYRK